MLEEYQTEIQMKVYSSNIGNR
uniref:Uncharacterized protein n=1 Tax=Arundo donax TaxID=35708 RepID=A0A0A9BJ99_ARUDO